MKQEIKKEWIPEEKCEDDNCPYHGELAVRGRAFTGKVIADRMSKTVSVKWDRRKYYPKYERYAKRKSTVKAHNPPCIDAKTGQKVRIAETRRLSKTKNFVVLAVLEDAPEEIKVERISEQQDKKEEKEDKVEEKEEKQETKEKAEEKAEEDKEDNEESKDIPAKSTVSNMTKDEIKQYAKEEWNVKLSTNDLKDDMIDQLFEEIGE